MKGGTAAGEPYVASVRDTFQAGWRFRLRASSPQSGYLYVMNDGPGNDGQDRLWTLHPEPGRSSPLLNANETAETGWFVFDENPGTERLWIVSSDSRIAAIEDHRGSDGEVTSAVAAREIRTLLGQLHASTSTSSAGEGLRSSSTVDRAAALLEIRHR
jgi:hypothetical protein